MIVPTLDLSNVSFDRDSLSQRIADWSLFGQLAIRNIAEDQIDDLEAVIKRMGGGVDLIVELSQWEEINALKLLNAGASYLLCGVDAAEGLETIPLERVRHCLEDDSEDQAIPQNHLMVLLEPTAARIAELEMARIDVLISADRLEEATPRIVESFEKVLVTDRPDGLWSTVIVDPMGVALGLAYSNAESLAHAIENRVGAYYSRSRGDLWIKGESSGATQSLLGIRFDCDRDCLQFRVTQASPGFCHRNTYTCFGAQRTIHSVTERLSQRLGDDDQNSFTRKLAADASMLETKLLEEAKELSDASQGDDHFEVAWEAADVLYFSLVAMLKNGVSLQDVHEELARRMNRVVRRKNKLETTDQ
mgnify:CR=1 FL=1